MKSNSFSVPLHRLVNTLNPKVPVNPLALKKARMLSCHNRRFFLSYSQFNSILTCFLIGTVSAPSWHRVGIVLAPCLHLICTVLCTMLEPCWHRRKTRVFKLVSHAPSNAKHTLKVSPFAGLCHGGDSPLKHPQKILP